MVRGCAVTLREKAERLLGATQDLDPQGFDWDHGYVAALRAAREDGTVEPIRPPELRPHDAYDSGWNAAVRALSRGPQ